MSTVAVPAYHLGILKGYLAGQNAPAEVFVAAEALYMAAVQGPLRADALDAIQAVREAAEKLVGMATVSPMVEVTCAKPDVSIAVPEEKEFELPPLTKRALEKASEKTDSAMASNQKQTDEDKIAAFLKAREVEQCSPAHASGHGHETIVAPSEPKIRKEWSPEARAAAAERMRARQARKKTEREPVEPEAVELEPPIFADAELRITVPIKKRPSQLTDADWLEIKARIAKGHSSEAIASDYDAELEDLEFFISSNQRREAKQPPGEARAPL